MRQRKIFDFPGTIRIKSRKDIEAVEHLGEYYKTDNLKLSLLVDDTLNKSKFGVKLAKGFENAVKRNRVKRVIREYLRTHKTDFPEKSLVMISAKNKTGSMVNPELRVELDSLFAKYRLRCR